MAELEPHRRKLVMEALDYYKIIRSKIPHAMPFWPHGLPDSEGEWVSLRLRRGERRFVAVWRIAGEAMNVQLPIQVQNGLEPAITYTYPQQHDSAWDWDKSAGVLTVVLPPGKTARLFEITL